MSTQVSEIYIDGVRHGVIKAKYVCRDFVEVTTGTYGKVVRGKESASVEVVCRTHRIPRTWWDSDRTNWSIVLDKHHYSKHAPVEAKREE